jgi:hypothetical protein
MTNTDAVAARVWASLSDHHRSGLAADWMVLDDDQRAHLCGRWAELPTDCKLVLLGACPLPPRKLPEPELIPLRARTDRSESRRHKLPKRSIIACLREEFVTEFERWWREDSSASERRLVRAITAPRR